MIERECFRCNAKTMTSGPIPPGWVMVDSWVYGAAASSNALLCKTCREDFSRFMDGKRDEHDGLLVIELRPESDAQRTFFNTLKSAITACAKVQRQSFEQWGAWALLRDSRSELQHYPEHKELLLKLLDAGREYAAGK